ncbi:MAG: hypothetical protein GY943_12235 [Chloroflexi bacterium]|nr:hypothetical protein [Chloroflexota bacterium]
MALKITAVSSTSPISVPPATVLVAFSGEVEDGGKFTEAGMNGFSDSQTATKFKKPEYRFLIVAEKFQTGFDEPLLHTMYC